MLASFFVVLLASCANKPSTIVEYEFPNNHAGVLCLKECLSDKGSCEYQKEQEIIQCKESNSNIMCDSRYYAKDCSSQYRLCYTRCGGLIKEIKLTPSPRKTK